MAGVISCQILTNQAGEDGIFSELEEIQLSLLNAVMLPPLNSWAQRRGQPIRCDLWPVQTPAMMFLLADKADPVFVVFTRRSGKVVLPKGGENTVAALIVTIVAATGDHELDTSLGRFVDIRHQLRKEIKGERIFGEYNRV